MVAVALNNYYPHGALILANEKCCYEKEKVVNELAYVVPRVIPL